MNERFAGSERINPPEDDNSIFLNTLLLSGEDAAPKIIERIFDFPSIKRVVVFGEPGANKTTIMLQLASELTKLDPQIEPSFIFYDNALAKIKKSLGLPILHTKEQYNLVSEELSNQMKDSFPRDEEREKSRKIQFVELVGLSARNRGISTLQEAADRVRSQNPMMQDTLFVAVAADARSLKDAGEVRKRIKEIDFSEDVLTLLKKFNINVTNYPKNVSIDEVSQKIIQFFGNMAPANRIKEIHNQVMQQARQSSAEDKYRLFEMLRLPKLDFPIDKVGVERSYLLSAALLQGRLFSLGVKQDMYDLSFRIADKGIVLFSPYNPKISKNIDLSKVLN